MQDRTETKEPTANDDRARMAWPVGGGALGSLIRAYDWSTTSLGPLAGWPQSRRTATDIMLQSPVPMVTLWGEQGVMIYNDAYSVFAGNRHPRLLGMTVREGWPEVADFNDHVMRVGLAGVTLAYKDQELTLHRTGKAEQVWMDLDYSPVLDESGNPAGVLAIVIETTERVRTRSELVAERDRSRGVLDGMAEGFGLLDREFRILDLNAEAMRLEIRPREAIVGRTHWEAYPGTEASELGQLYKRAMTERVPVTLEHCYRWDDGRDVWFEMRAYPVEQGLAIFYRDITARKCDESALRASEARLTVSEESLRLSTEAADIGTWDLDLTTDTLTWSDRTKAMFGISPHVVCSMVDFYAGLHPDDREITSAAFGSALDPALRATYDVEYRTIGKEDGAVRWVAAKGKALFDERGRCFRAIGTAIDITGRKRGEIRRLALLELNDRLREAGDIAELWYAAAEILGRTLDVSRAGYGTFDSVAETITIERDWTAAALESLAGVRSLRDYGTYLDELKRGRAVVVADIETDPRTSDSATLKAIGVQASVNIPIIEQAGLVAILYVAQASPREWTADEISFLREFADRTHSAVERRRAEAELRESEARLRAVFDTVPVGIVFAEAPSGRITGGNAQIEQIFGHPVLPSADIEHYRDWVSFHPDGRQVESDEYPLSRVIRGPEVRPEMEVLYRRSDGRDAFVRLIAAAIREEGGRVTGGVVAALDIDREKRAEARQLLFLSLADRLRQLSEAREIVAATVEFLGRHLSVSRVGFGEVSADGETVSYEKDYADGVAHLIGTFPLVAFGEKNVADLKRGLTTTYADVTADPRTRDADFAAIETRSAMAVPLIRDGRLRAALYLNHRHVREWTPDEVTLVEEVAARTWDALERARAEAQLRELNETLERRVKERTAELEQAQEALRQAQKMEAVGQLTGGIAHDFNNMLAVVIGSLDLLGRRIGTADPRAKRYVDAATDGARRAALLTQRLLAFSRQQPLKPEPIDVNRLVAGMSDLIRGSMGSDVRLETVLAAGIWRAHADPNQLENVILNLAVNARDAMPDGGRLTIETQNAHLDDRYVTAHLGVSAGQYVLIAVTDTGAGMLAEVIAKAFDPFFTTKEVGKGTGLGLSQVYGFVKQSDGHVKIYSEPGQGTTIKIYLPRLNGAGAETSEDETASDMPLGERQEVVLVVEDEPAVRQFSVDALTELGYRVLEADGATTALRLLEFHPEIALMFTDIVMPDINGAKLAVEARQRRPNLKVLFTTGYTRNAVVHNGVLDPGVELIGKPFTIEELAAKVRNVLDTPTVPGSG